MMSWMDLTRFEMFAMDQSRAAKLSLYGVTSTHVVASILENFLRVSRMNQRESMIDFDMYRALASPPFLCNGERSIMSWKSWLGKISTSCSIRRFGYPKI